MLVWEQRAFSHITEWYAASGRQVGREKKAFCSIINNI